MSDDTGILLCRVFPRLGSPVVFAILLFTALFISTAPAGYVGGVASTLERRFQLKSSELAFLNVVFDISSLLVLLLVTHYGHNRHRGRVLGAVFALAGVGALCNAVPHFIYPVPDALKDAKSGQSNNETIHLCGVEKNCGTNSNGLGGQTWWIALGSVFASFSSTVFPLAMPYIDDSVGKNATALYAAIILMSYSIGGVVGVFLATFSLSIPAYPAHANEAGFPSTNLDDSNYLGAWWLGYIIMGGSLLAISPFFFMLPKTLRKTSDRLQQEAEEAKTTPKEERKDEVADEAPEGFVPNVVHFLKSLLKAVGRSLRNVTIVFLILSGAAQLATFSGLQLFGAKYLEVQFYLDPVFSSILFGIVVIPSGIFGNLIGGCVVKVFGKTTLRIGYLLLIFTFITIIIDPIFLFVGCPNRQLVGVNQQYPELDAGTAASLEATCNMANCKCDVDFEPICGHDNLTYFSPCFAGCESSSVDEMNITRFSNCACISNATPSQYQAEDGSCPIEDCGAWLIYFIFGLFQSAVITLAAIPGFMLAMRCVEEQDRSITLSLSNFVSKVLGSIPGPIIYGAFLDIPCILRYQDQCDPGTTGNCLVYDNETLRYTYNGLTISFRIIFTVFSVIAVYTIRRKAKKEEENLIASNGAVEMDATKTGIENKGLEAEI